MARSWRRFSGVAAIAVLWSSLGAASAVGGFPLLGRQPLSWLVAAGPWPAALYRAGLAGGAVLLVAFHGQVRTRYRVGRGFSVAMLAGLGGQLVAAFVPIDGTPPAHRAHTVAALALGASLPVLMWRFAAAQSPGPWRRRAYRLAQVEAAACVVGVLLSRHGIAPPAEIVPAAAFHLWIVVLTLAGRAGGRHDAPGTAVADSQATPILA